MKQGGLYRDNSLHSAVCTPCQDANMVVGSNCTSMAQRFLGPDATGYPWRMRVKLMWHVRNTQQKCRLNLKCGLEYSEYNYPRKPAFPGLMMYSTGDLHFQVL